MRGTVGVCAALGNAALTRPLQRWLPRRLPGLRCAGMSVVPPTPKETVRTPSTTSRPRDGVTVKAKHASTRPCRRRHAPAEAARSHAYAILRIATCVARD